MLEFAVLLCGLGIDADVDQFYEHDPDVDWNRFGTAAARERDFVLIAVSERYRERWEGKHAPDEGPGSVREIHELMGQFNADQRRFQTRVKLVVLPGATEADIPAELRGLQKFVFEALTPTAAESLYRTVTGQPATPKPAIAPLRRLGPKGLGEQQEEAISEAERSVGDLARQIADLRIDLLRVRSALSSIPVEPREREHAGERQSPNVRVAMRLEEESDAIHARLRQLEGQASATREDGWVDRLDSTITQPKYAALALVIVAGALVAVVSGWGLVFLIVVVLGAAATVGVAAGAARSTVDVVLGLAVALAVLAIAYKAFSAVLVGAVLLAIACGALVVVRGRRLVGAGALLLLALGVSAYDGSDGGSRAKPRPAKQVAHTPSATPGTSTPTPSTTPSPVVTVSAPPSCDGPGLSGTEREQPSNDDPETSDGPLAGGVAVRGETETLNDEDWLHFCPAAKKVSLRLMSLTPGYDCEQMHGEVWKADAGEDDTALTDLAPENAWVDRESADVDPGELYRVKITADGKQCQWLLSVGPPGSLIGDASAPSTVPCVPVAERSAAGREGGLEPGESIDQVVPIAAGAFRERRSDGAVRLQAEGRIASANDIEWFSFCSGSERRAITLELLNEDLDPGNYASPCQDVTISLRDADGGEIANGEGEDGPARKSKIAWTLDPDARYYVVVSRDGDERCRWRLTAGPRSAFAEELPVGAWDGSA